MAGRIGYYGGIVTNGLVLNLDAAKRDSYSGSGTIWNDISDSGFSGTFTNGPVFDKGGIGNIYFDGTDDYITNIGTSSTFSFIQNTGIFTINAWVRPSVLGTTMYFLGNNDGTSSDKGFYLGKETTNNRLWLLVTYGVGGLSVYNFRVNNYFTDTNWVNVTVSSNGSNAIAYKNGTQFGLSSSTISNFSTGDSSRNLSIGRINNLTSSYWSGNVAVTQIYNRTLTPSEVLQNYNAIKGRYGL
jgi:hypothetical protein